MFTVEEIVQATNGVLRGNGEAEVTAVSTDSRTVSADELFVALRGEHFDGHVFIPVAAGKGVRIFIADAAWSETNEMPENSSVIVVRDTLRALGDLAAFHRSRFPVPVVGITGSNGKTTTKEMLAAILAAEGAGLKTKGNLNNLIGLPQMLFQLDKSHRWAVLEMGMSEFGEIDRLAEIARPDIGVVTNALAAHLETLGSIEGVAKAKGELFLRLMDGGKAVFNADDSLIARCPSPDGVRRISFGLNEADVKAEDIKSRGKAGQAFTLCLPSGKRQVELRAFGLHNVYNALAAAAAAFAFGLDADAIQTGLASFAPYDKRFSLEEVDGVTLIDDSYNANPGSVRAALLTLRDMKGAGRGILVLGDMLELGTASVSAHEEIGRLAATCIDSLYVIGEMSAAVARGASEAGLDASSIHQARNHGEITEDLLHVLRDGDYVLVKGSRGMRMETVADAIRNDRYSSTKKGNVV